MKKEIEFMFNVLEKDFEDYSQICKQMLVYSICDQNTQILIAEKISDSTSKICLSIGNLAKMAQNFSSNEKQNLKARLGVTQKGVSQIQENFLDKLNQTKNSVTFYQDSLKQIIENNKLNNYSTNAASKSVGLEKEV